MCLGSGARESALCRFSEVTHDSSSVLCLLVAMEDCVGLGGHTRAARLCSSATGPVDF